MAWECTDKSGDQEGHTQWNEVPKVVCGLTPSKERFIDRPEQFKKTRRKCLEALVWARPLACPRWLRLANSANSDLYRCKNIHNKATRHRKAFFVGLKQRKDMHVSDLDFVVGQVRKGAIHLDSAHKACGSHAAV